MTKEKQLHVSAYNSLMHVAMREGNGFNQVTNELPKRNGKAIRKSPYPQENKNQSLLNLEVYNNDVNKENHGDNETSFPRTTTQDPQVAYVNSLNYMPLDTTGTSNPEKLLQKLADEKNDLKSIVSRLTLLMSQGWPIPFSILRSKFSEIAASDGDILEALSVCAVQVRGNFVLHSRFLPQLSAADRNARTFILLLLQIDGSIHRTQLRRVLANNRKVSSQRLLALLKQVAIQTVDQGWKLKIEDDHAFLSQFPEQSALHQQFWEQQQERYEEQLEIYNAWYDLESP